MNRARLRATAVDGGLALLVTALAVVAIGAQLGDDKSSPGASAYLLAVGMGALLLLRRDWPVAVLVVSAVLVVAYHALGHPPLPLAIPVAVALYSAAEFGHVRWAVAVATALLLVSTVARVWEGDSLAVLFGYDLASQAALMAAMVLLGDAVRARRHLRAERQREAVRRVEAERLRIARELHDELGHTLSVITLHSDVAREALDDADTDAAAQALGAVRDAAGRASRELRATVRMLRAPDRVGGLNRLDALIEAARGGGLNIELKTESLEPLPEVIASAAYRIVQESLTNVARHAGARTATVEISCWAGALTVRVSDDGVGRHSWRPGNGVTGMRERVALLDGRFKAGPVRGGGWVVEAVLPLRGIA